MVMGAGWWLLAITAATVTAIASTWRMQFTMLCSCNTLYGHFTGMWVSVVVAIAAWCSIIWNGAGFSNPDDAAAALSVMSYQRPLLALSYMFNRAVGGGWMLTNLAIHIGCTMLVYFIAKKIKVPVIAAAIFAAHPMAGDAVASAGGRSSMLCALFVFGSVLALLHNSGKLCGLLAGLAMLVKPEGAVLLLLLPALAYIYYDKTTARLILAVMAIAAIALAPGYIKILSKSNTMPLLQEAGMPAAPPLMLHIPFFMSATGSYILPRLFGIGQLSSDPSIPYSDIGFLFGLYFIFTIPLMMLVAGDELSQRFRAMVAMLTITPLTIYLFAPLPDVIFEHRVYFVLAGASMLIASVAQRYSSAVIALFIVMSWARADVYSTPIHLWEDAARKAPSAVRPHVNLGSYYAIEGRLPEAEQQFRIALINNPKANVARRNLAHLFAQRGDLSRASKVLDYETAF